MGSGMMRSMMPALNRSGAVSFSASDASTFLFASRLTVAFRPRVTKVAEDLFLCVRAFDMADHEHRLAFVFGKARHDRVIVGETTIPMDFDESVEQQRDERLQAGPVRMARDLHA